jgi:predicted nucleotidyltransferase
MKKIEQIIKKLKEIMPIIEKKYSVKNLDIFGSYVRSEQKRKGDLDILVEFHETIDLFKYIELENYSNGVKG